jgi:hypothetical protein
MARHFDNAVNLYAQYQVLIAGTQYARGAVISTGLPAATRRKLWEEGVVTEVAPTGNRRKTVK